MLTSQAHQQPARLLFRALLLYTGISILLLWPISSLLVTHYEPSMPRSIIGKIILAPTYFAYYSIHLFYSISLVFLLLAWFLRPSYLMNFLFFWLTLNLYKTNLPISNGADRVLYMIAFWNMLIVYPSSLKLSLSSVTKHVMANCGVILLQLQVVIIYFVSGHDKLFSKVWRSGDAFSYIRHLEIMYNPWIGDWLNSAFWDFSLSWITIAFEVLFVVLVWFRTTRLYTLGVGIVFHLGIWFMLNLMDFALIMIISYIIFLSADDLPRIVNSVKRKFLRKQPVISAK